MPMVDTACQAADGELLRAYLESRSQSAVAELIARHQRLVHGACRRVLGEGQIADDAAQATFLVLLKKAPSLSAESSLACWLYHTARNQARTLRRSIARRSKHEAAAAATGGPMAADAPHEADVKAALPLLDDALDSLPQPQREAIVLRFFRGLSLAECAVEVGCPVRTLQTRLARGLERLRSRLAARGAAVSASAIPLMLEAEAAKAAPTALAGSIKAAAGAAKAATAKVAAALASGYWIAGALALPLAALAALAISQAKPMAAPAAATAPVAPAPALSLVTAATLDGHASDVVHALAFSPDGRELVSGGNDGAAILWDLASAAPRARLRGHTDRVNAVAFAPDGGHAASAGADRVIRVWDAATGTLSRALTGHATAVWCLAFAPDGTALASGSDDGEILVWRLDADAPPRRLGSHDGPMRSLLYMPDGRTLVSGANDGLVKWWDVASGRELDRRHGEGTIRDLSRSADGAVLAVRDGSDHVLLYAPDRALIGGIAVGRAPAGEDARVAVSPDGRQAAAGGADGRLTLWAIPSGRELSHLQTAPGIDAIAFSPDGHRIAVGTWDRLVRLLAITTRP
jgi:RNA polymerase sigma factor (sigma-70 family)